MGQTGSCAGGTHRKDETGAKQQQQKQQKRQLQLPVYGSGHTNMMWEDHDPDPTAAPHGKAATMTHGANINFGRDRMDSCVEESFVIDSLPGITENPIHIDLRFGRDKRKTLLQETDKIVVMKTPLMHATATIWVPPLDQNQNWEIGWVQACYFIKFRNSYGPYGFTSWEFPELNIGKPAVNDSSGKYFPFYGTGPELIRIRGPCVNSKTYNVSLTDAPMSQITLQVPSDHFKTSKECDLTGIVRQQKFNTWLIARNLNSNDIYPLRTLSWEVNVNIQINANKPKGSRAVLMDPKRQPKPYALKHVLSIPNEALQPPDANRAQMLIWRPFDSTQNIAIVVPPRHNLMPTQRELANSMVYR